MATYVESTRVDRTYRTAHIVRARTADMGPVTLCGYDVDDQWQLLSRPTRLCGRCDTNRRWHEDLPQRTSSSQIPTITPS